MALAKTLGDSFGVSFETNLCFLLLHNRNFSEQAVDAVREDLFSSSINKEIITSYCKLKRIQSGRPPTADSVMSDLMESYHKLENKPAHSSRFMNIRRTLRRLKKFSKIDPSTIDTLFIKDNLSRFITYQNLRYTLLTSVDNLEEGEFDRIRQDIEEAAQSGKILVPTELGVDFSDVETRLAGYAARSQNGRVHSPIGISSIDECLRGGLEPGTIGLIMAQTGAGKTMTMINAGAVGILAGKQVLHITLELSQDEVAVRYDARMLGCPINDILEQPSRYADIIREQVDRVKSRLWIKQWGSDEATVFDLRAYVKLLALKKDFRPDILIVDYADLLRPYRSHKDYRFELRDTIRALRQLATDLDVPIWTGSQVNERGFDAKKIGLSAVAEAKEKVNIADVVIALAQTGLEKRHRRLRMYLLKNRLGGKEGRRVHVTFNGETQTIKQSKDQLSGILDGESKPRRY